VYSTSYVSGPGATTFTIGREFWKKNASFQLNRGVYSGGSLYTVKNNIDLIGGNYGDGFYQSFGTNTSSRTINLMGLLVVGDLPTSNDYLLLTKQKNNTFTDVNDVTYSWEEGTGW
jgi:hypothetical protein